MKHKRTFSILIWAYRGKQKENEATLYARLTVNGKRAEISLGRKVDLTLWDEESGRAKGQSLEADRINEHIDLVKGELRQLYFQIKATGNEVTAGEIKNKYLGIEEDKKSLLEVFRYHNQEMEALIGKGIASGTCKRYSVTMGKVQRFLKIKYKKADLPLSELKYFLKTTDNLEHNTCIRYLKIVKKIANLAVRNEWIDRNPFQGFKCVTVDVEREILNDGEIRTLLSKQFVSKRLEEVRDIFIFCCYTGYAYSDLKSLTPDHVGIGLDGEKWIFTNRTKTDNRSNVMLLPVALQLIDKYKTHPVAVERGRLFPVKSNQKYNDYIKEIAAVCGIKKELTSHIARHTFATTITLANDVPIESVSSMLGHKSIRTTQIYAKVVQKKLSNDMKKLRSKLSEKSEGGTPLNQMAAL
jgi:site-specific recombinase XerD